VQGKSHLDGWGIGYYLHGVPHIIKSPKSAQDDEDFSSLAKSINSKTVIAHLRQATKGELSLLNCHPFQYGPWVMAHNGDCPAFHLIKAALIESLDSELRAHVFGHTDSEIFFALVLSELKKRSLLIDTLAPVREIASAIRATIGRIEEVYKSHGISEAPALNLALSNGHCLLAFRLGRSLHYYLAEEPELKELIICSEPINMEHRWHNVAERQIIALDHKMQFYCDL